jgi:lipopolysaccharide/colanic/teichoic acid biosynthesis glycosyltransferase
MVGRRDEPSPRPSQPTLWGLGPRELHDAYWASLGVACVRLGTGEEPQEGADLHLLLMGEQLAWFDLRSIRETLIWSGADVVRVDILSSGGGGYSEYVESDAEGFVRRIGRRYERAFRSRGSILLARSALDARRWSAAGGQAEAFAGFRRNRWFRFDRVSAEGFAVDAAGPRALQELANGLLLRWPQPDHVIEGLRAYPQRAADPERPPTVVALGDAEKDGSGVFGAEADAASFERDSTRVAPIWVGFRRDDDVLEAIGPEVILDDARAEPRPALEVRRIDELFSPSGGVRRKRVEEDRGGYLAIKRLLDIVGSVLALLVASPVLLAAAIAVAIDDGFPVFYAQERQARGGRIFRCWKFRTMRRNAEKLEAQLRAQNLCDGPQTNIRNDPRVTRIGRVLRPLQIDEFPQFWNVIIGDMSIVGPRPSPERENQFCPAWREARLSVRPGITGLWQVMRTREPGKDFQEWIRWDMEYVRRMGIGLDLWICVRTVWNLVVPRIGSLLGQGDGDAAAVAGAVDSSGSAEA